MLTNPALPTSPTCMVGSGLHASKEERVYLARLYWFTVEFGLLQGRRAAHLGGGILSSIGETAYALSGKPELQPFDLLEILRTPIASTSCSRPISCCLVSIPSWSGGRGIMAAVAEARRLGLRPPALPRCRQAGELTRIHSHDVS